MEQDIYAGRLAAELGVRKDAILHQIRSAARYKEREEKKGELARAVKQDTTVIRKANPDAEKFPRAAQAEETLIGVLVLHPDLITKAQEALPPDGMVTAFNRSVYRYLIERKTNGLLIDLPFFSADFDETQMAYLTRVVQSAKERAFTWEDTRQYINIIREENALRGLKAPETLGDEDIADILATLRDRKGKKES